MPKAELATAPIPKWHLKHLARLKQQIEVHLNGLVQAQEGLRLEDAIRHCLFAGGKRLRPLLVLMAAESLGVRAARAIDVACAIEMVHSASLILDDLPCMDDANQRRGAATCHLVYGEDIAILAAVTLITSAFKVVAMAATLTAEEKVAVSDILADALGTKGLSGGQEQDLRDMTNEVDEAALKEMEGRKTCALFVACMRAVAIIGGQKPEAVQALSEFGAHLGLAFQIFDDLLDQLGTTQSTGKDHAQDENRSTYVTILNPKEAEARALQELEASFRALDRAGINSEPLQLLAGSLLESFTAQVC